MNMATIVVHGGAGAGKSSEDGCIAAAQAGHRLLQDGGAALDAAVAAVVVLENDGRFNAGTGSKLRSDGVTIEMDASVMDCGGVLGAVAGLQSVRNPVLVARQVTATPHHLLCGAGAIDFARQNGHQPFDGFRHRAALADRAGQDRTSTASAQQSPSGAGPRPEEGCSGAGARTEQGCSGTGPRPEEGCDTVGAVVRDGAGRFAVAASTGGASPSLVGRVGDTPLIGCGFYAGAKGAVAATGIGEHIMRHLLAREVYQWLAEGMPLPQALQRGLGLVGDKVDLGLIAVTATESGAISNRDMPTWTLHTY